MEEDNLCLLRIEDKITKEILDYVVVNKANTFDDIKKQIKLKLDNINSTAITVRSVDINTVPLSEILEHVNAREFSILNKYYVAGGTENDTKVQV